MRCLKIVIGVLAAAFILLSIAAFGGLMSVAADEPHWSLVHRALEIVREHSIELRARHLPVPALDSPGDIAAGAADYNEMCTGCHLRPGLADTEVRGSLYPQPPDLTKVRRSNPAQTFWIIKHGIKMSAMPAWGRSHDDARIWAMVAFLQYLPRMTPEQYAVLASRDENDDSPGEAATANSSDKSVDPGAALDAFSAALARGSAADAKGWLLPNVTIFESGSLQGSREEYERHHMHEDIEFLKGRDIQRLARTTEEAQSVAWVSSYYRMRHRASEASADVLSDETAILIRTEDGWRIRHLHWAARRE